MAAKKRKKRTSPPCEGQAGNASAKPKRGRADGRLFRWRWPIVIALSLVIAGVVLFASWVRLFNVYFHFEDYVNDNLMSHLDTQVQRTFEKDKISLILVAKEQKDEQPSGASKADHRRYHAQLIDALSQAGAKVIAFDMWFDTDSPLYDSELVRATTAAEASGTWVFFGLNPEGQDYIPADLKTLSPDHWGNIAGGKPGKTKVVPVLKLADETSESPNLEPRERLVAPSLALKTVEALKYPNAKVQNFFNPMNSQILVRRPEGQPLQSIPVDNQLYFMVRLVGKDEMGEIRLYDEVVRQIQQKNRDYLSHFEGKIVLVGYQAGDVVSTLGGERYGTEIIANAISNILQSNYIRPLGFILHSSITLLMVGLGAALPLRFNKWTSYELPVKLPVVEKLPIPVVLLAITIVYLFISIVFYMFGRTLFDVSYHVAALFIAYLSAGALRNKLGFV